ncbi:MAG: hypothetical protein Q9M27_01950 [Mariprofundaceae bacterium]|nr:hypothetical protein [Mariprofundaceae bacterium]
MKKSQLLAFAVGMITGMGNGSVFVVCMNHFMGRAPYSTAGLWGFDAYNPTTYAGFEDFVMILFGVGFWAIMAIGLKQFAAIEGQPVLGEDFEAIEDASGR